MMIILVTMVTMTVISSCEDKCEDMKFSWESSLGISLVFMFMCVYVYVEIVREKLKSHISTAKTKPAFLMLKSR